MDKEQTLKTLELNAKRLSIEAFGQDQINNLIYKYIPETIQNFVSYVDSFWLLTKHRDMPEVYNTQERREFNKLVLSQPYTLLSTMDVIVPEGLIMSGVEYSALLKESMVHVGVTKANVARFDSYIKLLIGTLKGRMSTDLAIPKFAEISNTRDNLNKRLAKAFNSRNQTKVKWSDYVKRNQDWEIILNTTDYLVTAYADLKLNQLVEDVDNLKNNMDTLVDMIKNGKMEGASTVVPKELAVGAREVALELEMLAAVAYRSLAYINAVNANLKIYNEMFTTKK